MSKYYKDTHLKNTCAMHHVY